MRFILIVYANKDSEAGVPPDLLCNAIAENVNLAILGSYPFFPT